MDTLRQKQLQVNHLIAEGGTLDNAMLTHKLDDAMVGHSNVGIILIDADDRVLYTNSAGRRLHSGAVGRVPEANPVVSAKHRTMNLRFEGKTDASSVHGLPAAELPHDAGSLVRVAASANRYAALSPNLPRHSATAYCCGYLMT